MVAAIGPALELIVLILGQVFSYLARRRKAKAEQRKEIDLQYKKDMEALKLGLKKLRDVNRNVGDVDSRVEEDMRNDN